MKIVRRLLMVGLMVLVGWAAGTADAQASIVFPDQNLELAIRAELAKPSGPLTPEDLDDLQSLSAGRRNIVDLSGLEWATNLTSLDLSGNLVGDLLPLAGSTMLNYLEIRSNPLTNFSAVISGLTNLSTLYLGATSISDVGFLQNLKHLRLLNLDNNKINDLAPLATLPNLRDLDLSYNPITNVAALSSFTNLRSLYFSGNAISNVSGLTALSGLTSLTLYNNQISDLSPLASLIKLDNLGLSGNRISNYSVLAGLTNLTKLWLNDNAISNLDFVVELKALTVLSVSGSRLSDLNALAGLTNLFVIFADYNCLTNIEGIRYLPELLHGRFVGNRLELTPESTTLKVIQDLLVQGVNVIYQPQNEPPNIFCPSEWFVPTNATSSLRFYMVDDFTPASRMNLLALSSNTNLIPQENIAFAITGETYTLTVTPVADQTGVAWITVVITDAAGESASATIRVAVVAPEPVSISDPNLEVAVRLALDKSGGTLDNLDLLGLTYFGISDTLVTNLTGLERATNLSYFRFENSPLPSLAPLTSLSNLAGLCLQGAAISDLAPLQQLLQVNSLELDNNRIFDLSPLQGLTNLAFISVRQNLLTNINAVQTLPHLAQVNVNLNLLDLSPGSPAMLVVQGLEEDGVMVSYLPQRSPPALSIRPAWVIKRNTTSVLSFGAVDVGVIYDAGLAVTATCSNSNLLSDEHLEVGKSANADWFLRVTPQSNQVGATTITLTATNDVGMGSNAIILVTVVAPLPLDNQLVGGGDLFWVTGGDAPWFGQTVVSYDGGSAAQSGSIQNDQQSWMQTSFEGPGILTFWWKVSSEPNWDWLEFFVNGQKQPGRISGEVDWEQQTHLLSRGPQEVRWRYFKELADSFGLDAAWVDRISFTPLSWLEVIGTPTNGQCQLLLHPVVGKVFQLQSSTNLVQWYPMTVVLATNNAMAFLDVAANSRQHFYRLQDLSTGAIWMRNPRRVGNEFQLELHSPTGLRFEVQSSTNLISWNSVGVVTNTLGQVTFTDSNADGPSWRFYRALLLAP